MANTGTVTVIHLYKCARCGEDHQNENLEFEPLEYPVGEFTHWAPCPTNEQPILLHVVTGPYG